MRLALSAGAILALTSLLSAQLIPLQNPGEATEVRAGEVALDDASNEVPPAQAELAYSVVIENRSGGIVRVVDPPAQFLLARPGVDVGKVSRPAKSLNVSTYHASLEADSLTVAASAVDGVHIKAYSGAEGSPGAVISILPAESEHLFQGVGPFLEREDAIRTDIAAGRGIFGGAYPLIVGNPVSVYRDGVHVYFSPDNNAVMIGDIIIIEVRTPAQWPKELTAENRLAGSVVMRSEEGASTEIGQLATPIGGSARLDSDEYCAPGGISSTSTTMLAIDLALLGETGGLQLRSRAGGMEAGLGYNQGSPQYGIVLGRNGRDLSTEPPLFSGYIYPVSGLEEPRLLPRQLISVQLDGSSDWLVLTPLSAGMDISGLAALRIQWLHDTALDGGEEAAQPRDGLVEVGPADPPSLRRR
ncbi:hypothetical protein IIA79_05260 [bacterium]|nr:hypothetical protein [bacterium]